MQQQLHDAIAAALATLGADEASFVVERPADMSHGDYSTNAALTAAKPLGTNPRELAQALANALAGKIEGVEKVEVAGPGFVNFYISHEAVASMVSEAAANKAWGRSALYAGQRVMVEYTDPNPFKEFHIGHLMSNTIGEAIARTLEQAGATVVRANYQGDVGLHVAKAIWGKLHAPQDSSWGAAYAYGAQQYESDAQAKAEIEEINKKVYAKDDAEIAALYAQGRAESLAHFEELYAALGTKFDHYFFESESTPKGLALVRAHLGGVFEESDGAIVYRGEKVGLHTRVFINSIGLPTYEAKDLGLFELKQAIEPRLDRSITITASEQNDYFKVVLAAAKELPEVAGIATKTLHISHGMMRFASGKMSSRKGNVITGESLLRDLTAASKEKMEGRVLASADKTAQQVAVGAIKYAVLKQGSGKDIVFDPEQSLSLEGDSGPYLQYAHTRARSLLRAAAQQGFSADAGRMNAEASPQRPAAGADMRPVSDAGSAARGVLERTLIHFPEVVERAAKELEPHHVTTYLTELAGAFNSWYASERVIGSASERYGVLLVQAVAHALSQGLHLLGMPAPEEM